MPAWTTSMETPRINVHEFPERSAPIIGCMVFHGLPWNWAVSTSVQVSRSKWRMRPQSFHGSCCKSHGSGPGSVEARGMSSSFHTPFTRKLPWKFSEDPVSFRESIGTSMRLPRAPIQLPWKRSFCFHGSPDETTVSVGDPMMSARITTTGRRELMGPDERLLRSTG